MDNLGPDGTNCRPNFLPNDPAKPPPRSSGCVNLDMQIQTCVDDHGLQREANELALWIT